jgi:hypothetical protein
LAAGCAGSNEEGVTLTIGVMTGGTAQADADLPGVRLAEMQLSEAAKKVGLPHRFRFVFGTLGATDFAVEAPPVATDLVKQKGARALVVGYGAATRAINNLNYEADPGKRLGVPIMTISNSSGVNNPQHELIGGRDPEHWAFRFTQADDVESKFIARILHGLGSSGDASGDGKFKVSVFVAGDASGYEQVEDLRRLLTALRPDVIVEGIAYGDRGALATMIDWNKMADRVLGDTVTESLDDKGQVVSAIDDGAPTDSVAVYVDPEFAVPLMKAAKVKNYNQKKVGFHATESTAVVEQLGSAGDGYEVVTLVPLSGQSGNSLTESYKINKPGTEITSDSVRAYDGAVTAALGFVLAEGKPANPNDITGEKLRDALRSKLHTPGGTKVHIGDTDAIANAMSLIAKGTPIDLWAASGNNLWDMHQRVRQQFEQRQISGGKWVVVKIFDCPADPECPAINP